MLLPALPCPAAGLSVRAASTPEAYETTPTQLAGPFATGTSGDAEVESVMGVLEVGTIWLTLREQPCLPELLCQLPLSHLLLVLLLPQATSAAHAASAVQPAYPAAVQG